MSMLNGWASRKYQVGNSSEAKPRNKVCGVLAFRNMLEEIYAGWDTRFSVIGPFYCFLGLGSV